MPRWEYQGWDVEYPSDESGTILQVTAINDDIVREDLPIWQALNEAGKYGWELVSVVREPCASTVMLMILKRQVPD